MPSCTYRVKVVACTDLALLVDADGEEVWIPKSQIDEDSDIGDGSEKGDEGELTIPQWLAEAKGLE